MEKYLELKKLWLSSKDEVKIITSQRFSWLSSKKVLFTEVGCVSEEETEHFQRHANQVFPGITIEKLQKTHVPENHSYVSW